MGEGPRPPGLRLLQSQRPRDPRHRLRQLSRSGRPDGKGLPARAAQHGLVLGLPSQSRAEPKAGGRGHEHDLDPAEPRIRQRIPREEPHCSSNRLLDMSSISDKSKKRLSVLSNAPVATAAPNAANAGDTARPTYWKSL